MAFVPVIRKMHKPDRPKGVERAKMVEGARNDIGPY